MEEHAARVAAGGVSLVTGTRKAPDLTVVVISTNEADYLRACLRSVFRSKGNFECIVMDNASTDETPAVLSAEFKDDRLTSVRNPRKLGFIENNNIAMRMARGRYVLLLNPDTVVEPEAFEVMTRFMDGHPDAAVSTCRLYYRDGTPQPNCRRFPTPLTYLYRITGLDKLFPRHRAVRRYLLADFDFGKSQKVDWFITAFFFMRKAVIDKIGRLDESLLQPFYCEDLEWCYRARREGYSNYFVAGTSIIHDYQQTSRRKIGRLTWVHLCNIMLFYKRHGWSLLRGEVPSA